MRATLVIATHNRAPQLAACLASLRPQIAAAQCEVIVVDNGSTDDTAAVVAQAASGDVSLRLLSVPEPNRAKARNAGIAAARGAVVIFCDDDTLVPSGFIAAHLSAHAEHDPCVVAGPIINIADAAHMVPPSPAHYSRAFFCTCNASARKADLEGVGGFDERYDLYGWEDTDLGLRLRHSGLHRFFSWAAFIYHIKPAAAMTYERRRGLMLEKARMAARFVHKSPSTPVRLATGAYSANYLRSALLTLPPLRRWLERTARSSSNESPFARFATETLLDAEYLAALRAALHAQNGD